VINLDLTRAEWRARYHEREPYLSRGALTERPIGWSDIDQMLHTIEPGLPIMRMFQNGQLPDDAYIQDISDPGRTRRKLNKARFYEYLGNGATLQINWLEQHLLAAKRLCLEIGRFAGTHTSGNAYMSFTGAGSFGHHWDTHDVFVIQLIGRKRWKIFNPTFPHPLTFQTHDRSGHTPPAEPAIDLVLEEGDIMYLPRGWWHHVIPLDTGSFHLAVGSYEPSLFDYIVQTSAKFLEQQLDARRAFTPETYREALARLMYQLPKVLDDPASARAFELEWNERERMNAEFDLASLDAASSPLPGSALVSLTTCGVPQLEGGIIRVNGKQLGLVPLNQAIISALADVPSMRLEQLCSQLTEAPPDAVRHAVRELAQYLNVTIQQ
jgi:ribosomal protein L16 Arg81 hydroxylase